MNERVTQEMEFLRQRFPRLETKPEMNWVLIRGFELPKDRFDSGEISVHFLLPPGYPNTGPDNFFVDANLRMKGGSMPPNLNIGPSSASGVAAIPGDWAWFSWHPVSWHPAAKIEDGDNLITFVRGINMCLRGEGG